MKKVTRLFWALFWLFLLTNVVGFLRSNLSEYTVVKRSSKKKQVKLVFPSLSQAESYMSTIWLTNYGRATAMCQTDYYLANGNGERYWRVTSAISPHFTHVEPPPGYSAKQTEYSAISKCDAGVRGYATVYGPSGAVALYDAK